MSHIFLKLIIYYAFSFALFTKISRKLLIIIVSYLESALKPDDWKQVFGILLAQDCKSNLLGNAVQAQTK